MGAIAHSAPDGSSANQPLDEHLQNVAEIAAQFAKAFDSGQWGRLAGLWHDVGKFSHAFQCYIRGGDGLNAHMENTPGRVDHSNRVYVRYDNTWHLLDDNLYSFIRRFELLGFAKR